MEFQVEGKAEGASSWTRGTVNITPNSVLISFGSRGTSLNFADSRSPVRPLRNWIASVLGWRLACDYKAVTLQDTTLVIRLPFPISEELQLRFPNGIDAAKALAQINVRTL